MRSLITDKKTTRDEHSTYRDFFYLEISAVHYEPDAKIQETKRKVLETESIPFYLNALDEIAKANNGHLALKRLTWADIYFTAMLGYMNFMAKADLTAKHTNLKKVTETVLAVDSIKKWVAKRPQTDI